MTMPDDQLRGDRADQQPAKPYGDPPARPSALRWLLVLGPSAVILMAGYHLVGTVLTRLPETPTWPGPITWPDLGGTPNAAVPEPDGRSNGEAEAPFPPIGIGPRDGKGLDLRDGPERTDSAAGGREADHAFSVAEVLRRLPTADAAAGARSARMCAPCHPLGKDEWHKIGPYLWGVAGRPKASAPGFVYSSAMRARGGTWSPDELAAFLNNPRAAIPGPAMAFGGISDAQRVADVIAFLATLSDQPAAVTGRPGLP